MKILPILMLITLAITNIAYADEVIKRYPNSQSGKIVYQLSGMEQGTETIYYDQWGVREVKYKQATITMMGQNKTIKQMVLITDGGKWVYTIDLDKKTGKKMENPMFSKLSPEQRQQMMQGGEKMMQAMGAKKVGTDTVAGKTCNVWKMQKANSSVCIWKNLPLRVESQMGSMKVKNIATEVVEGIDIPEDKFTIPADIKIETVDLNKLQQQMQKMRQMMWQGQNHSDSQQMRPMMQRRMQQMREQHQQMQ